MFVSLLVFFIALWYLFFGAIHDLFKTTPFLHFLQSYSVLLPVLLIVNILVAWWLKRSKLLYSKFFLYLNILFLAFCISDAVLMINKMYNYKEITSANPVKFDQSKVTAKPNVYFLLFDEYAGYKSLQDSFGFKNDSLYSFLKTQNFKEIPVFSNYDFTLFSMASALNMQYVPENYIKNSLTQKDIQQRAGEIRNAQVFSIFKAMNYRIENYSIFDIKNYPALYTSSGLFPIHAGLLTNKLFHNRLLKGIGWWLATGRFEIPLFKRYYMLRKDAYNKQVEEMVNQSMAARSANPKFIYAHFLLPHGQFYRDSSGAYNTTEKIMDDKYLGDRKLYVAYLKYTNNIIKNLVKNANNNDPSAIVIIMSDHGFYDYNSFGNYDANNFNNFCFTRFPAAKPGSNNLPASNVNYFRYLFNTAYGQNLPYLPDSTVFVREDPVILR